MTRSKIIKLKSLLANDFGDDLEIIEENYKMLTAPGEHYGSIMLSVDVVIKRSCYEKPKILNLVAKLLPASQMLRDVFNVKVTFKKEVSAYLVIIPTLIWFQREYAVSKTNQLNMFPKCYGARVSLDENQSDTDDNAAIILENLKVQGYVMEDRMVGFDFEHAKLILEDLAKFHSVTVALRLLRPDVFSEKVSSLISGNPSFNELPQSFFDCILKQSVLIEELSPYRTKLQNFMNESLKDVEKLEEPLINSQFLAIIHSDYWVNNTMILRDVNESPIKNKIIDLQLLSLGSATQDLIFFLFTSVINSVLNNHYEDLIRVYYNKFIDNIKHFDLDVELFSWNAFLDEIEIVGPIEAFHALVMLKPIFTERNQIKNNLEDIQDSDFNRDDLLGAAYRKKLKDTVVALVGRNWI